MNVPFKTRLAPKRTAADESLAEVSGEFPDLAPALWRRPDIRTADMLDGLKEHREVRLALERECGPLSPNEIERLALFAGYRLGLEAK